MSTCRSPSPPPPGGRGRPAPPPPPAMPPCASPSPRGGGEPATAPPTSMSTCGYHSPRFSEDIAFLPQWLQPHRPPAVGERRKDIAGVSSPSCENCVFVRDPAQGSCLNGMTNAASCSGFRLHLSGDEGTPTGTASSSGNVVPFSLHLSSESTAQLSSIQANGLNSGTCKDLLGGFCIDGQAQEIKTALQNQSHSKDFQEICKMASEKINKSCDSKGHRRQQLSGAKVDVRKLRNADVHDAVELSIAASEAMVIAEMIRLDSESDKLTTTALEAALHVKEARKQCFVVELENSNGSPESDLDETDGLSELDETEMLDAFQDVGLSLAQTACASQGQNISGLKQKLSQASSHSCNAEAHVLEICSSEKQNIRWNSHNVDANDYVSDSLANNGSEGGVAVHTNAGRRKHVKELFNKETSFISESMDSMDEFPSASRTVSMEMAASSRASFLQKNEDFCEENQGAEAVQLCSQVVCPSLSFVDPLCSIVPCSIPCNGGPPSQGPECKQSKGEEEEWINPKVSPLKQHLEGEAGPSCTSLVKAAASNILFRRRRHSSLRPFSTVAPRSYVSGSSETHNDVDVAICQQERFTTLTLNKKIRRVQASKVFVENNVEAGNLQGFSKVLKKPSYGKGISEHQNTQSVKRKKDQFSEAKISTRKTKDRRMQTKSRLSWSDSRLIDTMEPREHIPNKEAIFRGLDFLLTGFQSHKEKEIESLIRRLGGYVLSKVPPCPLDKRSKLAELSRCKPPIVLSPKKVSTAKFLYGCAINSWMLNTSWLFDSIQAGILLPPGKYFIRQVHSMKSTSMFDQFLHLKNNKLLFDGVGFLILGKISFCSKFSNIIKHGGGQVFVSLQGLVQSLKDRSSSHGIILVANEASASRHLSYCGLEHDIKTVPASWVIGSLFSGKLIPLKKDRCALFRRIKMPSFQQQQAFDMSQEI
uniref:BRCT domain-containing protein n=1 Tax=Oryza brachyantha TaxID=4533 RepID=J3LU16_ORYBR